MLLFWPFTVLAGQSSIGLTSGRGDHFSLFAALAYFPSQAVIEIFQQIYYIGARSTTIIMLVSFFTGMVLASNRTMHWFNSVHKAQSAPCVSFADQGVGSGAHGYHDYRPGRFGYCGRDRHPTYQRTDRCAAYHADQSAALSCQPQNLAAIVSFPYLPLYLI